MFARLVYRQDVPTWLDCHRHAFEFFAGVPDRVVPDYVPRNIIGLLFPARLCARLRPNAAMPGVGGGKLQMAAT